LNAGNNLGQDKIMNTEPKKSDYMLLFRGTNWHKGLSPEQMQRVMGEWMSWFERLTHEGIATAGHPLEPQGKVVTGKKGRVVADGPFAEAKETVGGYFLLKVNSLDEAITIAQQCPGLDYGVIVEVRPVAGQCPLALELAEAQLAQVNV
jgi:hypothetical protein